MSHVDLPAGLVVRKRLHARRNGAVHLAERESDGRLVVAKTYSADRRGQEQARKEHDLLQQMDHPQIVRPIGLSLEGGLPTLLLEHVAGSTLRSWVATRIPDVLPAVRVAAQIADILASVHGHRVVHRDITPRNVMLDVETLEVTLIDFGLAVPIGAASRAGHPGSLGSGRAGTLTFIAPELTGRMGRGFEFRSDLYSLGATLFYVLTGRPPFEGSDALELIHAHIARRPDDLRSVRHDVPEPLARVVMRLLQKEPEERYPSARVLHADLLELARQLQETGEIRPDTPLAGLDSTSQRLAFASAPLGRDVERQRLCAIYERASRGSLEAVLVSGDPGTGKSTLPELLRPAIAASGGYLVSGKFDPYQKRPYAGWIAAIESLTQQLLLLSDAQLAGLGSALREGLGAVAAALVDLVPDLAFILGEVPPAPALGPRETQERLALALRRAIRVLATPEHPLVVVLDDLHAADGASLYLTESLLCAGESVGALLIVGASRSEPESPIEGWLGEIERRGARLERLPLGPLDRAAIETLLSGALSRAPEEVGPLAHWLEVKTGSNPLLVRELLEHLQREGLLRPSSRGWTWDDAEIAAVPSPDSAIELLLARIARLEPDAKRVLRFAACVSDELEVDMLVELGCDQRAVVETAVVELLDTGLIVPARSGLRFAHDRIREAARAELDQDDRERLHYDTGKLLLDRTAPEDLPARATLVADHLNQALGRVPESLRLELVRIDLLAGQRALAAGAGDQAATYLAVARELFEVGGWESDPALGVGLHLTAAEAEFQCMRYERALEVLRALDGRELAVLDQTRVEVRRITISALTQRPEEALRYALERLGDVGVRWSVPPSRLQVWIGLWRGRRALARSELGRRWTPHPAPDPRWVASQILTAATGSLAFRVDASLAALFSFRAVATYTDQGYVGIPAMALAGSALAELTVGRHPDRAGSLLPVVQEWRERVEARDPALALRLGFTLHMAQSWIARRRKALAPLSQLAEQARELGDREFAYYAGLNQIVVLTLAGEPVERMEERLRSLADGVVRGGHRYPEAVPSHRIHAQLLSSDPPDIERTMRELDRELEPIPVSGVVYARTLWLQVLCVLGRPDLALEQSDRVYAELLRVVPFTHVVDHVLYRGLAAGALALEAPRQGRGRRVRILRECLRQLELWASWCPDFAHMAVLLRAQWADIRGDDPKAWSLYVQAARGATQEGYLHHAALAQEQRARSLARGRRGTEAEKAVREAIALYRRWGAVARACQLERGQADYPRG